MHTSGETGLAVVMALFVTLIVSTLAAGMVVVARHETESTQSYATMAQARYAAESGVAAAARFLLSSEYAASAPGTAADSLFDYDTTVWPVQRANGSTGDVVLSTDADGSNYSVAAVVAAFQEAATGSLDVGTGTVTFGARARLLAMRQIDDAFSLQPRLLQTWEITGVGRRGGLGAAQVEVVAVIERESRPVFNYAAFATFNGCAAMSFSGNAYTSSYDSTVPVAAGSTPALFEAGGHVGTNGNLSEVGNAVINGTLSTPRSGVGACTANNVTAATIDGNAEVTEGLVQLPQSVEFPTPAPPDPLPPTTNHTISGASCPGGYSSVCSVTGGETVFTPAGDAPVVIGNLNLTGQATVVLKSGTYIMNSLSIAGQSKIVVDSSSGGPVLIQIAGEGSGSTVIDIEGNGFVNSTWDPNMLRIEYAGTKTVKMAGNGDTAAIIYAPNAVGNFSGNADFYGAVVVRQLNSSGNMGIHYDINLQTSALTAGNPVMNSFSWIAF